MLYKNSTAGFTLVELIVVITILAILGTIGFISIGNYATKSRDAARTSDIMTLAKGMETLIAKGQMLPRPNGSVDITASGTVIGYQGYVGTGVIGVLNASAMQDPLEKTAYTYAVNSNGTRYQLLGFSENALANNSSSPEFLGLEEAYASDYSTRGIITQGNKIGVLLFSGSKSPVQEGSSAVDVVTTSTPLVAILNKNSTIAGTGSSLRVVTATMSNSSPQTSFVKSCKEILDYSSHSKNGYYYINPAGTGAFQVYCDMTTDGGGWTQLVNYQFAQTTQLEQIPDGGSMAFVATDGGLNLTSMIGGHQYRVLNYTGSVTGISPTPTQAYLRVSIGITNNINTWNNPSLLDPNPSKSMYTSYSICDSQLVPQVATPSYRNMKHWVSTAGGWHGSTTLETGVQGINLSNKLSDDFKVCMFSNAWEQLTTGNSTRLPSVSKFEAFFR